jgi:aspartate oxidase
LPYEKYYYAYKYPYYGYKYGYPYSKEDKKQLVDQLSQEVLKEKVLELKEKEDADLKQRLKDNLLFDLIAQSHPFGGKEYTYAEQVKKQLDWEDIDKRLMDIALSIKEEQKELEEAKKELASLQAKEQELSAGEEQLKKVREKLLEKAIDYIIASGRQE